jgi:L-phenylalanine/L-methionine N-acetyltransferase
MAASYGEALALIDRVKTPAMLNCDNPISLGRALPEGFTIRQFSKADNRALFELFNEDRFQHFGTGMGPFKTPEDMQAWLNTLCTKRFEVVSAFHGDVVGFAGLYISEGRHSHVGSILLGVREKFQKRGIGSALLKILIATADIIVGLKRLQLTVFSDNDIAVQLYHKFGFEIEGRHRHFLRRDTGFVDLLTMARISVYDHGNRRSCASHDAAR